MRSAWLVTALTLSLPVVPNGLAAQGPPPPPRSAIPPGASYLGIGIQEITAERAKALKVPEASGVEVTRVGSQSPAERAGLRAGDVVVQYNGTAVEGLEQLSRLVRETPVGREVKLDIYRNGAPQTIMVKIGQHPPPYGFPDGFGFRSPDVPRVFMGLRSPMLGVEAEPIEGQFAQYFGVNDGVLVHSVMKGSAAEKSGIKAGDVILRVDSFRVATPADITGRLHAARAKSVPVTLMRDHKEISLTVDLPQPR